MVVAGIVGVAGGCPIATAAVGLRTTSDDTDTDVEAARTAPVPPGRCRALRPPDDTPMQFGDYESRGLRVRFGENASATAIAEIVTPSGARARILRRGVTIYGFGGSVNDLDGDRRRVSTMELSVDGENLVAIVFSRELSRLRDAVPYRDLHPLELRWTRKGQPLNGLRCVADSDGDRRPELVVQTSEDRCPGGCSETSPRTTRLRAYVVSGRDARAGRVRVGGRLAPLARTVDAR